MRCPTCSELNSSGVRYCTNCGEDIEQKVNGVIRYMKVDKDTQMQLRELDDTRG